MALTGLRPAKEYLNPSHAALLNGAHDIFIQDEYAKADANTDYFTAKWMKLKAGKYTFKTIVDDSCRYLLDGTEIGNVTGSGTVKTFEVVIQQDGVSRFDAIYHNTPGNSPSYYAYAIFRGDELIEVSRASDFIGDLVDIPDSALGPKPPFSDDVRLTYPVFLADPNWKNGIDERIEWYTDVLESETGAEQRRAVRRYPRRSIEASFLRWEQNRTILDAMVAGIGTAPALIPMWHDMTGTLEEEVAGSTRLTGNFVDKDFTVGGVILIRHDMTWEYEVNVIAAMTDDTITLQTGLQLDTIRGTRLYPLKVGRNLEGFNGSLITDQVATYQVRFELTEKYDIEPSWGSMPVYDRTGLHIFRVPDNWASSNQITDTRKSYTFDNLTGLLSVVDPGGQSSGSAKKSYTITGRDEDRKLRQLLFMLQGRTRTFHLPLGTNDFILVRDISPADGAIIVRRCGYTQYLGGNQAVKRDILVELYNGTAIPTTIISSRIVGDEEWLFLSQSIPATKMSDVLRIGYMPVARLDVDSVEIHRLTDGAGVSQLSLTFKTFDDRRKATPIPLP